MFAELITNLWVCSSHIDCCFCFSCVVRQLYYEFYWLRIWIFKHFLWEPPGSNSRRRRRTEETEKKKFHEALLLANLTLCVGLEEANDRTYRERLKWDEYVSLLNKEGPNAFYGMYRMHYPSYMKLCKLIDNFVRKNVEMEYPRMLSNLPKGRRDFTAMFFHCTPNNPIGLPSSSTSTSLSVADAKLGVEGRLVLVVLLLLLLLVLQLLLLLLLYSFTSSLSLTSPSLMTLLAWIVLNKTGWFVVLNGSGCSLDIAEKNGGVVGYSIIFEL